MILPVRATNAVSERSFSTLRSVKTYLRSFMTEELQSSFLILDTQKKQADKLKLLEVANQFCFKNEYCFSN